MKERSPKFKNDKYRKARGGYSRLLEVHCEHCDELLFLYQKDGPGPLKRVYLDRMVNANASNKQLVCKSCKRIIGTYYVYEKEKRPAYRLYQDSITKKIRKL